MGGLSQHAEAEAVLPCEQAQRNLGRHAKSKDFELNPLTYSFGLLSSSHSWCPSALSPNYHEQMWCPDLGTQWKRRQQRRCVIQLTLFTWTEESHGLGEDKEAYEGGENGVNRGGAKRQKHTTPGIRWSLPTQLLIRRSTASLSRGERTGSPVFLWIVVVSVKYAESGSLGAQKMHPQKFRQSPRNDPAPTVR